MFSALRQVQRTASISLNTNLCGLFMGLIRECIYQLLIFRVSALGWIQGTASISLNTLQLVHGLQDGMHLSAMTQRPGYVRRSCSRLTHCGLGGLAPTAVTAVTAAAPRPLGAVGCACTSVRVCLSVCCLFGLSVCLVCLSVV